MRDLHSNIKPLVALSTTAISSNTTTVGEIIDLQSFESLEFIIQSGNLTDGTYTVLIEEGEDSGLSDASAVDDKDLLGTEALASFVSSEDNTLKKIGYTGGMRYARLSIISASTSTGGTIGAIAVKGNASHLPVE